MKKKPFCSCTCRSEWTVSACFYTKRTNGFDIRLMRLPKIIVWKCSSNSSSDLPTWMMNCSSTVCACVVRPKPFGLPNVDVPNVDQLWQGSWSFNRAHSDTIRFASIEPFFLPQLPYFVLTHQAWRTLINQNDDAVQLSNSMGSDQPTSDSDERCEVKWANDMRIRIHYRRANYSFYFSRENVSSHKHITFHLAMMLDPYRCWNRRIYLLEILNAPIPNSCPTQHQLFHFRAIIIFWLHCNIIHIYCWKGKVQMK